MKFSIITVCLNERDHIGRNIKSVSSQTYKNYEHIIVDGGSIDGTKEIINDFGLSYISSKPKGIFNAMNIGIENASGDYYIFLNANDWFFDENVLQKIHSFIVRNSGFQLYYGVKMNYDCELNRTGKVFPHRKENKFLSEAGFFISQQTSFIHKSVFKQFRFDESMKLLADKKLTICLHLSGKSKNTEMIVANYYRCGVSFLMKDSKIKDQEMKEITTFIKRLNTPKPGEIDDCSVIR